MTERQRGLDVTPSAPDGGFSGVLGFCATLLSVRHPPGTSSSTSLQKTAVYPPCSVSRLTL